MTSANIYQGFSQIPNEFIEAIPNLGLTTNQLNLCLKLIKISFGKPVFRLNDSIRHSIKVFLNVKKWDRAQRVLNLLQEKGLLFCREVKCQIEVTFGKLLQLATSIHPDAFSKTPDFATPPSPSNTLINTSSIYISKETAKNSFLPYTRQPENKKEGILTVNKINAAVPQSKNTVGINIQAGKQTLVREPKNDLKINCQYVSAISDHMKRCNYTENEVATVKTEIFRANSKGIPAERINEIAKAIIYNKIDRSTKNKPINDLRAFIISRLFSKDDKHVFQKLDHLAEFPYCEIRTLEDIQREAQKQKQVEVVKSNELELKAVQETRIAEEAKAKALKNKLKDGFEKALEAETNELKIKKAWFMVPEVLAIESLYNKLFETGIHEIANTEAASIIENS